MREYGDRVRTRALRGVDLDLHRGEFAALIGPSGSGKSTLLNIIGLLDRPSAGRYRFGDFFRIGLPLQLVVGSVALVVAAYVWA